MSTKVTDLESILYVSITGSDPDINEIRTAIHNNFTKDKKLHITLSTSSNNFESAIQLYYLIKDSQIKTTSNCYGVLGMFAIIVSAACDHATIGHGSIATISPIAFSTPIPCSITRLEDIVVGLKRLQDIISKILREKSGSNINFLERSREYTPEQMVEMKLMTSISDKLEIPEGNSKSIYD